MRVTALGALNPTWDIQLTEMLGNQQRTDFLNNDWSMSYGDSDLMDIYREDIRFSDRVLPFEENADYTYCKFSNVDWHRDDHDDLFYTLHVLKGEGELWVAKRNPTKVKLKEGQSYMFNSCLYHKAVVGQGVIEVLIGGVERRVARAVMKNKEMAIPVNPYQ